MLDGIPVVLQVALPNTNEVTFEPDNDNYPIVGGTATLLENKTIKVSHITLYMGAAAGEVLEYINIDGEHVLLTPYETGYGGVATVTVFEINIKEKCGQDFIPLRNILAAKLSATTGAGDAVIFVHGIAVDRIV